MSDGIRVLITGPAPEDLERIGRLLEGKPSLEVTARPLASGIVDPLAGVSPAPALLVHCAGPQWEAELQALAQRPARSRPPVIVVSRETDPRMMRKAMQAGARDFFTLQVTEAELMDAVRQASREQAGGEGPQAPSHLTVVMNAKGGSGATVVACNMATIIASTADQAAAIVDLDLQFGTLPLYFDLKPEHDLLDILEALDEMDTLALPGYMAAHKSGVRVIGNPGDRLVLPGDVSKTQTSKLLDLLARTFPQVVVDLPRQVDPLTTMVMERADRVVIVMQPGITHLRDTRRLLGILKDGLAIPRDRLLVVANRFDPKGRISHDDIQDTLGHRHLMTLPNDFKRLSESVNLGVPLVESAKNAPITRALTALTLRAAGLEPTKKRGLLARTLFGQA